MKPAQCCEATPNLTSLQSKILHYYPRPHLKVCYHLSEFQMWNIPIKAGSPISRLHDDMEYSLKARFNIR